ncbi:MAG: transposase, partial [Chloroflexota bacterium]|nr:transposase [Chloroflexota bacterium]
MFKMNFSHLQIPLTSHIDELPEKLRIGLENSWSGVFYRDFFCRIDETPFEVLYADCPSRPNVPVNVLVGLEFLKAGNGWTDEQLFEQFAYNIQVRYAVGYRQLGEGHFELRTLYNFRERLSRHMQETGINLMDQVFAQVTDEQIEAYQIKTGRQRMDSTQVASNIRQMGRIQLLVTVLQRVPRMLSEEDQAHYVEALAPYLKGHAGQYVYRLKGEEIGDHLQRIGTLMQRLLVELKPAYEDEPIYQVLARVFDEHFQMIDGAVHSKPNDQLSASSLQSPDDLEATYRNKRGQGFQGYTANITETCEPDNELQLITKVQVAPNNVDDTQLLDEALHELKERTELDTLYTDGGYGSPETDDALRENDV